MPEIMKDMFIDRAVQEKKELVESKEYKKADEIQKQEYLIALRLRNVLKLE